MTSNTDLLLHLQYADHITTHDVLNALFNYTRNYQLIFENLLKIKLNIPVAENERTFRARDLTQTQHYQTIQKLLSAFSDYLVKLDQEYAKTRLQPEALSTLNRKLLQAVAEMVSQLQKAYQGHAPTFATVLTELMSLQSIFLAKLHQEHTPGDKGVLASTLASKPELGATEKLVFIRIFHKSMPDFITGKGNFAWFKSLLESIKNAEKHGFAVYEDEEQVIKSIKDEHSGYLTLKISPTQDITAQRPLKLCPIVGVPLLTVSNIEVSNIIKLTHHGKTYNIVDGSLQLKSRDY